MVSLICLNGRNWLAQPDDEAWECATAQRDNCFTWIEDVPRAQRLLEEQVHTPDGTFCLNRLVAENHPTQEQNLSATWLWRITGRPVQSEYATDLIFAQEHRLARALPRSVHHGIKSFGSRDVLRFLGHKPPANGVGKFAGELHSSLKHRPEGLRIKHFVNGNSLKLYNQQVSSCAWKPPSTIPRSSKFGGPKRTTRSKR